MIYSLISSHTHARKLSVHALYVPKFIPFFRQERIDHGNLIRWTKGFGNPNTEGHDVVAMFRKSLAKYVSIHISVV